LEKDQFVGKINWITSGELKNHYIAATNETITEEAAANNNLRLLPIGTFVIAIYGLEAAGVRSTGSITTETSTISQACMAFLPKGEISNEFLYSWYMKHGNTIGLRYAQGTKQQNLSYDIIERFKISYPNVLEQRKLEKFISLLDRRIATQSGLIEDLQKLKAALVERLFCNKQNWRRYKYRDLLTPISERNSRNQFSNVLSASQEFGMVSRTDLDIDIKFDKSAVTTYKIVRDGDYVLHLRSFQGGLAFSSMTGICSPAYTILRPVKELEYGFFQEYFMSRSFINSLRLVTYGIRDGRSINVDEFLDMPVEIPDSATQCRIISILSIMNRRLRLAIKQNENYFKQKQYILQQMFI
jgi:type I restriction enzyme S subunit